MVILIASLCPCHCPRPVIDNILDPGLSPHIRPGPGPCFVPGPGPGPVSQTWNKHKTLHNPKILAILLTPKNRFALSRQKLLKLFWFLQQLCKQGNIFFDNP